jgi:hypothetical protein
MHTNSVSSRNKHTHHLHYEDQPLAAVQINNHIHSENDMKYLNNLCGQNAELFNVKAGGACSYHWALKG